MRFVSLVTAFSFVCALVVAGRPAAAEPPLVVPDVRESAPVRIVDSSTNVLAPPAPSDLIDIVCFAFVNDGPRTAVKAAFDLTLVDAAGTVLAVQKMNPAGRFERGARSAFSHGGDPRVTPNGNCYPIYAYGRNGSTFMYRAGKGVPQTKIAAILLAPREVDYDDGTAWHASVPSRTAGSRVDLPVPAPSVAVPNGPPILTWRNPPETQLHIDDAYLMGGPWLYACISFTNLAPKVARRIRADVTMLDRGGTVVNVEHIAIAGRIKPNDPLTDQYGSCLSINGRFDGDTYLYQRGETVPLGRIIVSPAGMEFEDGSAWTAPPPPPIGSRAPFP